MVCSFIQHVLLILSLIDMTVIGLGTLTEKGLLIFNYYVFTYTLIVIRFLLVV